MTECRYLPLMVWFELRCHILQIFSLVDDRSTNDELIIKVYAYLKAVMAPQANKHAATNALFSKMSLPGQLPPGTFDLDAEFVAKSNLPDEKLQSFLAADITGSNGKLRKGLIYGIGEQSIANLAEVGIVTVHQLTGRILQHCSRGGFDAERASRWLKSIGCSPAHTKAVVVQLFSRLEVGAPNLSCFIRGSAAYESATVPCSVSPRHITVAPSIVYGLYTAITRGFAAMHHSTSLPGPSGDVPWWRLPVCRNGGTRM